MSTTKNVSLAIPEEGEVFKARLMRSSASAIDDSLPGMTQKLIFLATGGTGGHIFPALALKKALEQNGFKVKILADSKFAKYHAFDRDHILIPSASFAVGLFSCLFTLMKGFFKALGYIIQKKPDLIIGFGGYATYPSMLAAMLLGKKIILHEANNVIGKVNRLLLWRAEYLATGFPSIRGVATKYRHKIVYTGNPVRSEITASKSKVPKGQLSILIIGGSQGAKIFSKIIPEMILQLPKNIREKLYICQQAREEDIKELKALYKKEGIDCEIQSFFTDMNYRFAQANLVIARSGASTIAELIKVGIPAIFIPYPYAADNHQYYNAKMIIDAEASWLVKEDQDSAKNLLQIIESIGINPSILKEYAIKLKSMDQNAEENILKLIEKI